MNDQSIQISELNESPALPVPRASFLQRFAAYFVDTMILGLVTGCLGSFFGVIGSAARGGPWSDMAGAIGLVIPAAYFFWAYSTDGQTVGKRILKIKVVSRDGTPLNWRKGLLRTVGYFLSSLPFGLGFLWALWDEDMQAAHDKIAGTCVVPASVQAESLQATYSQSLARRRQMSWLAALSVLALLALAGFLLWVQKEVSEVIQMGPWPGPQVPAKEVVSVDLSTLGLAAGPIQNQRDDETWAGGSFADGALITYSGGGNIVVMVWALKYEDSAMARNDFARVQSWAAEPGNCGRSTYAYLRNSGVIHCQYSDVYNKIFWNDRWIITILAAEGTQMAPDILVDLVRDALAAHWATISKAAY